LLYYQNNYVESLSIDDDTAESLF